MGINLYPTLIPDGQPEPTYPYNYDQLVGVINDRLAVPAPCAIGVTGSLVNGDLTINVTVTQDAGTTMDNARVQVVVTEIDIPYNDPNYNNEMNFVNRDMILDNNGTTLTFTGNTAEATVTGTLDPTWTQDNLIIVVWVENGSTLEVYQATRENIDMFLADPNAPAIPTDFAAVPDPSGALSCDLDWINPSLDFSGNPLTELLEMRLYRDGNLIYTDSNPTIGGAGSYTDIPTDPGLYNYLISGYNSFGEGPGAITSIWVGEDVPNVVESLLLEDVGGNGYLTWINPTTGLNGGPFNEAIIGYHIERSDGTLFEVNGIATEYTDNTVPTGEFSYTVQPYNSVGDGGIETSNAIWFGEGTIFNVYIVCDDYPGETTWDVVEDGGGVLFSGGPYTSAGEIVDVDCVLAQGDYGFTIYDAWGDGICCDYGIGSYTLTLDGTVIMEGGEFGDFESTSFTVGEPADPGYIEGTVVISDGAGDVEDVVVEAGGETTNPDTDGTYSIELPAGTYDVTATLAGYDTEVIEDVVVTEGNTTSGVDFSLVTEGDEIVIVATKLNGNYPNPFNPVTTIDYSIKDAGNVTLEVYNLRGQLVKTLVNEVKETGNHTANWNSTDNSNKSVSSGVYFYKMKTAEYTSTKKMILMK